MVVSAQHSQQSSVPRRCSPVPQVFSGKLAERSGVSITANVEPFLPQAYGFNRGAAFPHSQSTPYNTFNGLVTWSDPADDAFAFNLTRQYHEAIWQKAIELGVSSPDAKFPPNYVWPPESCSIPSSDVRYIGYFGHSGRGYLWRELGPSPKNQREHRPPQYF